MPQLTAFTGILLLATLTEALVEYLVKPWLGLADSFGGAQPADPRTAAAMDLATRYTAAALGILLCLAYGADLLILAGLSCPWPWVGPVITGILAGRGANFVHDFAGRWLMP